MKRSTDRILTTHMGSLPRPDVLADLLVAQAEGKPVDAARIPALTDEAMDHIVRRQLDCGIDVGNDGEMPRSTFFGYITGRMSGFGGRSNRRPILDMQHFPKWWQNFQARGVRRLNVYGFPAAIGPVRYESLDGAKAELDAFARALARQTQRFAETFVTAVSPGFAACSLENQHYDSHEAYVFALARELKQEYEFIVAQGHVLQIELARPRHRTRRLLPGRAAAEVHRSDGDARRGAERGPGRHPARAGALPRLLGQPRQPARERRAGARRAAGLLPGEGRRALPALRQSASQPRGRRVPDAEAARSHDPGLRRGRNRRTTTSSTRR